VHTHNQITPAPNPFTPKSGWEPKAFVGRENEIAFFRKKLNEAREGKCDHFLVLGNWGIGKTTLLREYKRIAQEERILASLITISEYNETDTLRDGVKQLIEDIPRGLPISIHKLKKFTKQMDSWGIQILGTGFNFSRGIVDMQPQSLFIDTLLTLWNDLNAKSDVVVILLDDSQNFSEISGIFTILKNVLSHEEIVRDTRYLFGIACTPNNWKEFLVRHHPIGRYFTPRILLGKLTKQKTYEALDRILEDTGIKFDEEIKVNIYKYTEGHPYELQVLCNKLYDNQIGGKVIMDVWDVSFTSALQELGGGIFNSLYERASPQEKRVLYLAALMDKPVKQSQIFERSTREGVNLPENTIKSSLSRLVAKQLLIKPDKFKFSITDNLFKEYILYFDMDNR
jgi:AAA+ ATPase superfamily predicted ATPase